MRQDGTILVSGGAGFIGSNLVRVLVNETSHRVMVVDKLTYAGNLESIQDLVDEDRVRFAQVDICDEAALETVFVESRPQAVMHLAAESHVDRSIDGPAEFVQTNLVGTFQMLQAARRHFDRLPETERREFRFLHVSTDEVYGSLRPEDPAFSETTPYDPRSPYSASKAGSDHLARAWFHTFGLPVLVTNCSNNYGPYQFPEKLIPVVIIKAIQGEPIPVYGQGENIRDWLYVEDHARALHTVLQQGQLGETYNIGGKNEQRNIDLVHKLCELLDELRPRADGESYQSQITFVTDRPGHDLRYAIDNTKIQKDLSWQPREDFASGFRKTVEWYLTHEPWWQRILSGDYRLERLGTA